MYYNLKEMNTFIPQGICQINSKYYITMYDSKHLLKSKVRIYSSNFLNYHEIILDNYNHLGGITYDNINKKIWITEGNSLVRYDLKLFNKNILKKESAFIIKNLKNYKNKNSIAYVCYHNNYLYCGNFTILGIFHKPVLLTYKLNKNGSIIKNSKKSINFFNKTQGITFYNNLMIVSTSYSRFFNSKLIVNNNYYSMPPMMEQIIINNKKQLVILSEYNYKSKNKKHSVNDITILDIINSFLQ